MPLIILSNTTHKKYKKLKLKEKDMSDLNPHHFSESAVCNTTYEIWSTVAILFRLDFDTLRHLSPAPYTAELHRHVEICDFLKLLDLKNVIWILSNIFDWIQSITLISNEWNRLKIHSDVNVNVITLFV
jgi:hypothetical protein